MKTEPFQIDLVYDSTEPDGVIEGIFKVVDDTLTLCFETGRGKRPKEFKEVKNMVSLFVFERVKAKD